LREREGKFYAAGTLFRKKGTKKSSQKGADQSREGEPLYLAKKKASLVHERIEGSPFDQEKGGDRKVKGKKKKGGSPIPRSRKEEEKRAIRTREEKLRL